jgi:transposase
VEHIGIDVHKKTSQVCIQTKEGELWERRVATTREALAKVFADRARAKIVMEASTDSEWVARWLEELGHEVIVADPNFAPMYATRSRKVKTDRRDARALCDACRLGAYRPAHRASDAARHRRAQVAVRDALVRTRTKYISLTRALLRREGLSPRSGGAATFAARIEELSLPAHLSLEVAPLLVMLEQLTAQIRDADKRLAELAKGDEVVERLCTVPSIGPVTAVTFVAVVDQIGRFHNASQVRAYLGLVPRELSSGEKRMRGHITKTGSRRLRSLLVEAAWGILRHKRPETAPLREWTLRIAARRGKRIAAVALARKLAGILYAMWRDGTRFEATVSREEVAAA